MEPLTRTASRLRPPRTDRDVELIHAVEEYERLLQAGEIPDREAFLARHPAVRRELASCLAGLELVHRAGKALELRSLAQAAAAPPVELGDFLILREVGRGGMGLVYEAEQVSLGRRVALKVLPFAAVLDPKKIQRFKNEAHAAALLHHSNIVPVFAIGFEKGVHFYAMQFIDGKSLREVVESLRAKRTKDPGAIASRAYFQTAARLGLQAAAALAHAHSQKIIHRDVKPSNLLLDRRRNLWVSDFGLARIEGDHGLTVTGDVLGTLRYMSPEQALGTRGLVDQRTDVYSLGVTLYELLTLEPAFAGESREEVLRKIATEEPRRPSQLNPAVPADLETIVLKAAAKAPGDRYASARLLAEDLKRFLEDRPILARRPSLVRRGLKWLKRRKLAAAAAALLLVALFSSALLVHKSRMDTAARQLQNFQTKVLDGVMLLHIRNTPVRDGSKAEAPDTTRHGPADCGCAQESRLEAWIEAMGKAWPVQIDSFDAALETFEAAKDLQPRRPEPYFYRARTLWLLGRTEEALAEVARLEEVDPGSFPAANLRQAIRGESAPVPPPNADPKAALARAWVEADQALRKKHWQEASAACSAALEAIRLDRNLYAGANLEVLLARGRARFEEKDYAGAIEDIAAARVMGPHLALPQFILAKAYYQNGDQGRAAQVFQGLYRSGKPQDAAASNIADTYHELGNFAEALSWAERIENEAVREEARAHFLHHLGRKQDGLEAAKRAVRAAPESAIAQRRLFMALMDLGRDEEAIEAQMKAVALAPNDAFERYNLGTALSNKNRLEEAEKELAEAARLQPDLAHAHYNLARIYHLTGRLDKAEGAYRKCIDVDPGFENAHWARYGIAMALAQKGDRKGAIAEMREVIRLTPRDLDLYFKLCDLLQKDGKPEEVVETLRLAVEQHPENAVLRHNLGVTLESLGRNEEAFPEYKKAVAIDPELYGSWLNLGSNLANQGKKEEAIPYYLKAEELKAESPEASISLGKIHGELGRPQEALQHYRRALERSGDDLGDGIWLLNFGRCLETEGEADEAAKAYGRALDAIDVAGQAERGSRAILLGLAQAHQFLAGRRLKAGQPEEGQTHAAKALDLYRLRAERPRAGAEELNDYAWVLITAEPAKMRDPRRALPVAQRAVELSEGKAWWVLDTLALAHFRNGDAKGAIAVLEKARSLLPPPGEDDARSYLPQPGPRMAIAEIRKHVETSLKEFKGARDGKKKITKTKARKS